MKKRVFITGGSGFGGSGLAKALLKKGYEITVLSTRAPNNCPNLQKEIDEGKIKYLWKAVHDITQEDISGDVSERPPCIVCHFAAQADVPRGITSPEYTAYQNVMGTLRILEVLKDSPMSIEKFILPSSGNVFGRPLYIPIDERHPLTPHNAYAASKAAQELYAMAYYRCYGIPVVIFRNGIVYGPGMRKNIFIYVWLKQLLQGKPITVQGGDQTRDPCYVTDTIDAWVKAVEASPRKVVGEAFQVSRGHEYDVEYIAHKCVETVRGKVNSENYVKHTIHRPGEKGQRECFNISKAKKILGYEPKVDLEEGLAKTLEWVKKEEK